MFYDAFLCTVHENDLLNQRRPYAAGWQYSN